MLYGRKLRCSMDFIHPDLTRKINEQQQKQKVYHDKRPVSGIFVLEIQYLLGTFLMDRNGFRDMLRL